jgi:hypothetical protein
MTDYADNGLQYTTKLRSAAMSRDATLSQNAYSRFLSQQRGSRSLADLERTRTQGLEGLASGFHRRGLTHSGIARQGQNLYASNWMQGRQDINSQLMEAMRGYDIGDANANAQYMNTEADVQAQKQQDILNTAAQLQQYRPFLGG